jgi:hypothetical protein
VRQDSCLASIWCEVKVKSGAVSEFQAAAHTVALYLDGNEGSHEPNYFEFSTELIGVPTFSGGCEIARGLIRLDHRAPEILGFIVCHLISPVSKSC